MKRMVTAPGILLGISVVIAGMGVWWLTQPPIHAQLMTETRDVDVIVTGIETWELTDRAPNAAFTWYRMVALSLEAQGWVAHQQVAPDIYSAPAQPVPPIRFGARIRVVQKRLSRDSDDAEVLFQRRLPQIIA